MNNACVLDTDVFSFLFRSRPEAQLYQQHLVGKTLVISFMTVAEVRLGMRRANWGAARTAAMEGFLKQFVLVDSNDDLCSVWAGVVDWERRQGRVISTQDAWVAATAILNQIPLISHNRRHFEGIANLDLISES